MFEHRRTGYSPWPPYRPLRPRGHLCQHARGKRRRRRRKARPACSSWIARTPFDNSRTLGNRPRPGSGCTYRFLVGTCHANYMVSSEWGTAAAIRESGVVPGRTCSPTNMWLSHAVHFWGTWPGERTCRLDRPRRAIYQMVLEVRPAHDPAKEYGFPRRRCRHNEFGRVDLDLAARERKVHHRQDGDHPARACGQGASARSAQGLRRRAAARDRHRSLARRPISPLCLVLGGTGEAEANTTSRTP